VGGVCGACGEDERCIRYPFLVGKYEGKRTLGSPGLRWEDYIKLYNDQRNVQVCNLFIYLLLPYMFRAFF
jgi:hypothetical protein